MWNFHGLKQLVIAAESGVVSVNPPAASTAGGGEGEGASSGFLTAAVQNIPEQWLTSQQECVKTDFFFKLRK